MAQKGSMGGVGILLEATTDKARAQRAHQGSTYELAESAQEVSRYLPGAHADGLNELTRLTKKAASDHKASQQVLRILSSASLLLRGCVVAERLRLSREAEAGTGEVGLIGLTRHYCSCELAASQWPRRMRTYQETGKKTPAS